MAATRSIPRSARSDRAKTAMAMIARNSELALDLSAAALKNGLVGPTMSPRGLRVRLGERSPAMTGAGSGVGREV